LRNRYDPAAIEPGNDKLNTSLGGATDSQIGDLGEQTAAVFLDDAEDATIVTMGDCGMQPRRRCHASWPTEAISERTTVGRSRKKTASAESWPWIHASPRLR
jgi:hypothetical protein